MLKQANCTCQNIPYMNYNSKSIDNTMNSIIVKKPSEILTNKNALIYLIFREMYFNKITDAVENAGDFNKNNKRFYFTFYDYINKTKHRLNSREIWLAKNQIFTREKLQCNVEYQLYQGQLVNNIVNHNKYQHLKCGNGYNFLSNEGFNDYLKKNIYYYVYPSSECCETRNVTNPLDIFEQRKNIYINFFNIYQQSLYYRRILNKINQIKSSSLQGKVNNLFVNIPKHIFKNVGDRRRLYSGKNAMTIYNTVRKRY